MTSTLALSTPIAPWGALLQGALHRNRSQPHSRFVQLATVDRAGRPHCRTVVFRGLWHSPSYPAPGSQAMIQPVIQPTQPVIQPTQSDSGPVLQFVTDRRSEKITDLSHSPIVEICWYFAKTREQFRISGAIAVVTAESPDPIGQGQRHHLWHNLSDAARLQFAWPDPGQPRSPQEAFTPPTPDPLQPLENFCILLLTPHQIDYLSLRGNPQDRYLYQRSIAPPHTWTAQTVNP